jgi:hypothetical protein
LSKVRWIFANIPPGLSPIIGESHIGEDPVPQSGFVLVMRLKFTSHFIFNQTDLDHVFKLAFDAERLRQNERFNAKNDDHLQSKNQNRGLINAIINHNNKIKDIENKFNLIVNNFANTSHIREVIDKTKELEKYVFDGPRPHQS